MLYNAEIQCCKCGVMIIVTSEMKQRLIDKGNEFYCINGHCQGFSVSTVDKLRKTIINKDETIGMLERQIEQFKKPKRGRSIKK